MNKKILCWIKAYTHLILALIFLGLNVSGAEPININTASKESIIANLNGIGVAKAAAIIAFREKNGGFTKPEDLLQISGIGEKVLSKFKDDLLFEPSDKATLISDSNKAATDKNAINSGKQSVLKSIADANKELETEQSVTPIDKKVQKKISKKQQKAMDAKAE